jgi:hypothetical protein
MYRWFVGLGIDDPVWHPRAFTTNRVKPRSPIWIELLVTSTPDFAIESEH